MNAKIINYEEIISSLSFNIDPSKAEGGDIKEFLFPKGNLVDKKTLNDQFIKIIELSSAEEEPLTSTNKMNRSNVYKELTIAPRAIIDRMYLITAASPVLEFKFSHIYDDKFMSLSSFKLIDEDQRVDEVANQKKA